MAQIVVVAGDDVVVMVLVVVVVVDILSAWLRWFLERCVARQGWDRD